MNTKHLLITGGTGFIGTALVNTAVTKRIQCTVLTRHIQRARTLLPPEVNLIESLREIDANQPIDWVINLAGESLVSHRWNKKSKALFLESRLNVTQGLIDWISTRETPPDALINASAIGWYGNKGDEELNEQSSFHAEFIHDLCDQWEAVAQQAHKYDVRVCCIRTGLVLGHGGAMTNMLPTFKFGIGGSLGDGEQWWSWIHVQDLVRLYLFCAEQVVCGIVNGTSPHPVKQKEFAKMLGKVMHRPSVIRTPGAALKLVFGEFAEALLLHGQQVFPDVALQEGFEFYFPELEEALQEVVSMPAFKKAS